MATKNPQAVDTDETEDSANSERDESQVFICSKCHTQCDADDLLVIDMSVLAKAEGVTITPENLPKFALCEDCSDPDEWYYTLAESLISSRAYQERRKKGVPKKRWAGLNPNRKATDNPRLQSTVTDAEAEAVVCCFSCGGKMSRKEALAPGWAGCNILMAIRLQLDNLSDRRSVYVSSEDLLRSGKDGFNTCSECMKVLLPNLKEKALELGLSANSPDFARIGSWSLIQMILGVRRAEEAKPNMYKV